MLWPSRWGHTDGSGLLGIFMGFVGWVWCCWELQHRHSTALSSWPKNKTPGPSQLGSCCSSLGLRRCFWNSQEGKDHRRENLGRAKVEGGSWKALGWIGELEKLTWAFLDAVCEGGGGHFEKGHNSPVAFLRGTRPSEHFLALENVGDQALLPTEIFWVVLARGI